MMRKRIQKGGNFLHDLILGGQDGLVNVLGIVLGMAAATQELRFILIAGLAATFAESISMAAVAYTSTKAESDYLTKEERKLSSKFKDISIIQQEHSPIKSAFIVGISAIIGSLIPIIPFFLAPILITQTFAIVFAIILSALALFITGSIEGRITSKKWLNEGLRLMLIGMIAAFAGFLIGKLLGASV